MFTGLIEEIGTIRSVIQGAKGGQIVIEGAKVLEDVRIGDSISTNGVCLTVVHVEKTSFTVDVMPETMRKSNLKNAGNGCKVNLERALKVGDRFGGHMVSGHVDDVGKIIALEKEDNATWVSIQVDPTLMKYIVEKGSVAIDGTSLTVASTSQNAFRVSIIPLTGEETTLLTKEIYDEVNIECDMIAKYVEKMMMDSKPKESKLTMEFLGEHGFL